MTDTIYNKNKNRSQENLPYVYYLEWTELNKKYIGCRYAKDCHPDDLFVTYFTSSKTVKELLDNNQYPDIIKILSTHDSADEALEEEKRLLIENDVMKNHEFLNMAINSSNVSEEYIQIAKEKTCLEKYGVENVFQSKEVKQIFIEKYGVENPMQNEEIKEKAKQTTIERYGVDCYSKTDEFREKVKQTSIEKYGVNHYSKTKQYREKKKRTYIKNWGVDHPLKSEKGKKLLKKSVNKKYGVDNVFQSKEVKEKIKQTSIERYGVDRYSKTEEGKEKSRQVRLNEKNECPFGCITKSGNKYFNNGNLVRHMKSKHPEYQFQK